MSHRLFNSLVVSSTLLLEGGLTGCASSATEHASSEPASPESGAETSSGAETASATTNGDLVAETVPEAAPTAVTMASCEGGWHTTKAGPRCEIDTSGVTVCCPSYATVTAESRASICCVQPDAAQ